MTSGLPPRVSQALLWSSSEGSNHCPSLRTGGQPVHAGLLCRPGMRAGQVLSERRLRDAEPLDGRERWRGSGGDIERRYVDPCEVEGQHVLHLSHLARRLILGSVGELAGRLRWAACGVTISETRGDRGTVAVRQSWMLCSATGVSRSRIVRIGDDGEPTSNVV